MFSELPKLFERDFAIGFFLPMACFFTALYGLSAEFHLTLLLHSFKEPSLLVGTTMLGVIAWFGGILLLIMNRSLYRLFEGYTWPLNKDWATYVERQRLRLLRKRTDDNEVTAKLLKDAGKPKSRTLASEHRALSQREAERFPDYKNDVLATAFGNNIRAFERYPTVMYGIDSIDGWSRLLAVIPKDYRQLVDAAKAQTDFWLNLWLLSYLTIAVYLGLAAWAQQVHSPMIFLAAVAVAWFSSINASTAAREWGVLVKASFDVFLPDLYNKLGFAPPQGPVPGSISRTEWETWDSFSKAILFREPSCLPSRSLQPQNLEALGKDSEPFEASDMGDNSSDVEQNGTDNNAPNVSSE